MFKIASWNVNSLRVRLPHVLDWLHANDVDILALQETKVTDEHFPSPVFHDLGYHVAFSGQKSYNGVAIISGSTISEITKAMPGYDDTQQRMLAATIADIRLINVYIPNGAEVGTKKYEYKLAWLEELIFFIKEQLKIYPKVALVGDFNIAPDDRDVYDPLEWYERIMVSTAERHAFQRLISLGLVDSFRNFPQKEQIFSWWDYRAGAFRRNQGLRIDHILLNAGLNELCTLAKIDVEPRSSQCPSDHAPVWVALDYQQ